MSALQGGTKDTKAAPKTGGKSKKDNSHNPTAAKPPKKGPHTHLQGTFTDTTTGLLPPGLTHPYTADPTPDPPYGDPNTAEPEPEWIPKKWDRHIWETWLENVIQTHLYKIHQSREDFDTNTQQHHQDEKPLRSMEAFIRLTKRLGYNWDTKHHSETLGVPWGDGPLQRNAFQQIPPC